MIGKTLAFLALLAAGVSVGYTAWETRNLRAVVDRMAAGNETGVTEMMFSMTHAEDQLARIRETLELHGGDGRAQDSESLEEKFAAIVTATQTELLQQELTRWAGRLEERREKALVGLRESLEQKLSRSAAEAREGDRRQAELKALVERNQESLTSRLEELDEAFARSSRSDEQAAALASLEKRLDAVLKAAESGRESLAQRNARDDERWKEVLLSLRENKEALQQRYAELAARLDRQSAARAPANPPRTGSPRRDAQAERERLLAFCAEVPQSAICRDL